MSEQLAIDWIHQSNINTIDNKCTDPHSKPLTENEGLFASLPHYINYLQASGKSPHTVGSFSRDIRNLSEFFPATPLIEISTQGLRDFLAGFVKQGAKPKTVLRKVTSLKNYFRWLTNEGVISHDPSAHLAFVRVLPPLPEILTDQEAVLFIEASQQSTPEHLLALLLLCAGLKRSEVIELTKDDINIQDERSPFVRIKSGNRYKERSLRLPLDFVASYRNILRDHASGDKLFDYSERKLNYVLKEIADRAGIRKKVSCQILRDSFAVRLLKAGESMDIMLEKLGLAPTTANFETKDKYQRLATLTSSH